MEPWIDNLFPALRKQLNISEDKQFDDTTNYVDENISKSEIKDAKVGINELQTNENELNSKEHLNLSSLYRSIDSLSTAGS